MWSSHWDLVHLQSMTLMCLVTWAFGFTSSSSFNHKPEQSKASSSREIGSVQAALCTEAPWLRVMKD